MIRALTILALAGPSTALASSEVSFELGRLHNGDPNYDVFSDRDGIPTRGVRVGVGVHENVSIIGGWHHGARGSTVYYDDGEVETSFQSAFTSDTFSLGAKAEYGLWNFFYPYLTANGLVMRGLMRFDDDPSRSNNPGQVKKGGAAPGLMTTAGLEFRIPQGGAPFTLAIYAESGYGYVAPIRFGEYGTIQPDGWAFRSGIGIRF